MPRESHPRPKDIPRYGMMANACSALESSVVTSHAELADAQKGEIPWGAFKSAMSFRSGGAFAHLAVEARLSFCTRMVGAGGADVRPHTLYRSC